MGVSRLRFHKDDPMRYLHVPRRKRVDVDGGSESDALDDDTGADDEFDRDEVRNRGEVVSERDLR